MKGFLLTHRGMEDIAALEIEELIGQKSIINESCAVFNIKRYEDLFKLCYLSQSAKGVYFLFSEFEYKDLFNDFKKNIENIDFNGWLGKKVSFKVKCIKDFENDISTPDFEKEFGAIIIGQIEKKSKYRQKVDLNNPEMIFFVYLKKDKCYFGIDFSGFDLSKRSYNIFTNPASIKGTIAYSMARLCGYNKKESFLDCFSGSGIIPIEAALFASGFPVNFYNKDKFIFLKFNRFKDVNFKKFFLSMDRNAKEIQLEIYSLDSSMKHINYAKKNSKIAGVGKKINFSRMDMEWLDTKFKKDSIDRIASKLPSSGILDLDKVYNEFFYQAEYIVKDKGKISLIGKAELIEKFSDKYKFKIEQKRTIFSGKEANNVFVLSK